MMFSNVLQATIIGLLSSVLRQYSLVHARSTYLQEAWAGWFAWAMVYAGCLVYSHKRRQSAEDLDRPKRPHSEVWRARLTTAGLGTAALTAHLTRSRGILAAANPMITLITLATARAFWSKADELHLPQVTQSTSFTEIQEPVWLDRPLLPLRTTIRIPVNLVLLLLLTVSGAASPVVLTVANSLLFVAAQTAIFTFVPHLVRTSLPPTTNVRTLIDWSSFQQLSLYTFVLFSGFLAYLLSFSPISWPSLWSLCWAAAETTWWISLFMLCSETQSTTATTFETVASSFHEVVAADAPLSLLPASIASTVALWQSVSGIRPSHTPRYRLYLLLAIPCYSLSHSRHGTSSRVGHQEHILSMHPIESIIQEAQVAFSSLLVAQSQTLERAVREYTKRYGREPPPNFSQWFDLAVQHDFVLIDEFDSIMIMFEPFWGVAPSVLRKLVANSQDQFPEFIAEYKVDGGSITTALGHDADWFRQSLIRLLPSEWAGMLPNMSLAVSVRDEPTVCVPRDALDNAMRLARSRAFDQISEMELARPDNAHSPRFLNVGRQEAWEAMTISCPVQSTARHPFCTSSTPNESLSFIRNITKSKDVCQNCDFQHLEGFLMAPETLRLTHSLVPIWSQGKPSSFNDITLPSPYYLARNGDYVEAEDPDWEDKASGLYWVGAATGGHTTEANWKQMQRQRMTLMTQHNSSTPIELLHEVRPGLWSAYTTNMSVVNALFSTRIVGVTPQCEHAACEAQKQAFGVGEKEVKDPVSAVFAHKIALDMDGNSFSGRFYKLLRSKSMVMKQTVFSEWHDDRVFPWIHYVPVSTKFGDLPELVRFLATTERGDKIAARIAREGAEWAGKALRETDLQLVWLRMLLEYGRIMDLDRDN